MNKYIGYEIQQLGILDLAYAVEMVHVASLILDQIPTMDNALMRRGHSTVHHEFGEKMTILEIIARLSRCT